MKPLNNQEKKVYDYIRSNPGCTTRDIIRDTFITCPSARITTLRKKGVNIQSVGKVRFAGSQPFERYAIIEEPTQLTLTN